MVLPRTVQVELEIMDRLIGFGLWNRYIRFSRQINNSLVALGGLSARGRCELSD